MRQSYFRAFAKRLGVSRHTLNEALKALQIEPSSQQEGVVVECLDEAQWSAWVERPEIDVPDKDVDPGEIPSSAGDPEAVSA